MTTATPTMAGLLASAGAARLGAGVPVECTGTTSPAATYAAPVVHQGSTLHLSSTWTQGAIAMPSSLVMFGRKNRPTRPLSERSP